MAEQSPRETDEYKAAMEIEKWKEEQEHLFENQVGDLFILSSFQFYLRCFVDEAKSFVLLSLVLLLKSCFSAGYVV